MPTESVLVLNDPPARLHSQRVPSTNTVAIVVQDHLGVDDVQQFMLQMCLLAIGGRDGEIQSINMEQYEVSRLVRITFFDVRTACKFREWLEQDSRFSVVLDFRGGSNRSVVVPHGTSTLDTIVDKFSQFGEIEKLWFNPDGSHTIDYFDARAPLKIAHQINDAARLL